MTNINYIKICDYILRNPKKSIKKYKTEFLEILKDINEEQLDSILLKMTYSKILTEKKIKFRNMFYPTYIVNLDNLDTISRQNLCKLD